MRQLWPDSFVEQANLTVNISISALRKVLGETPGRQQSRPYRSAGTASARQYRRFYFFFWAAATAIIRSRVGCNCSGWRMTFKNTERGSPKKEMPPKYR